VGTLQRSLFAIPIESSEAHTDTAQAIANNIDFPLTLASQHFLPPPTGKYQCALKPRLSNRGRRLTRRLCRGGQCRLITANHQTNPASFRELPSTDQRAIGGDSKRTV